MEHKDFIITPITKIIEEATVAVKLLNDGMHTIPLMNYLFHSVFLQMTGAQEQKLKCVCWEVATIDYEFRYNWLNNKSDGKIGECSNFDDKTNVYKKLLERLQSDISVTTSFLDEKKDLLSKAKSCVEEFGKQLLFKSAESKFNDFKSFTEDLSTEDLMTPNGLFSEKKINGKTLKEIYTKKLYRQRNREAHNTLSYQENMPTLSMLSNKDYYFDNYFIYFYILILIDGIIIILFKNFLIY